MNNPAPMPFVRFETIVESTKDENGHNLYSNKIMAYVTSPGSRDETVKVAEEWINQLKEKGTTRGPFDSAANEYYLWHEKFSKMLQHYKDGNGLDHDGTPLRASLAFTPAEIAQCENVKIYTIEALSTCSEEALGRMGLGGRVLKNKATKILESAENSKVAEENAALRLKVEELTAKIEHLASLVGDEGQKKRGRPKATDD